MCVPGTNSAQSEAAARDFPFGIKQSRFPGSYKKILDLGSVVHWELFYT